MPNERVCVFVAVELRDRILADDERGTRGLEERLDDRCISSQYLHLLSYVKSCYIANSKERTKVL